MEPMCVMEAKQEFVDDAVMDAQASMLTDFLGMIQDEIQECVEDGRDAEVVRLQSLEDRLRARYEL